LRSGEVKALRWREDVDLIARTITVNQQTCYGITTTPKGRTRRTIPMTSALELALKRLQVVREGFVVRNLDGSQKTDGQANAVILRICCRAGLPEKRWHTLRPLARHPCGAVRREPVSGCSRGWGTSGSTRR
jgi:integrase